MIDPDAFEPSTRGTTTSFVDSSALFALFHPKDDCHESARAFHDHVREGHLPYRRLVTNDYVLDEVATRLRRRVNHSRAVQALETVEESELYTVEFTHEEIVTAAITRFREYGDQQLSFTDCVIATHMQSESRGPPLDHLLTYDGDFDVFGFTAVPHDR